MKLINFFDLSTKLSLGIRVTILLGVTLFYILAFKVFYHTTGYLGPALAILPIITAAWLFGKWAGVLAGFLIVPLAIWLFSMIGVAELENWSNRWPGVIIGVFTGGMIGWSRDLLVKLQERTKELLKEREALQEEIGKRQRVKRALEKSQEAARILLEHAPFGMVAIDQNGNFKYINSKFKILFGYDLNDIPNGRTWLKKAFPDPVYRHHVISSWNEDVKIFMPGEKNLRTFTVTCQDETKKIVNFIAVQLEGGETLMTCEDITEFKQAEETLKITKFSVDRANESIYWIGPEGQLLYVNEKAAYSLGYTQPELLALTIFDIAPEFPKEGWDDRWAEIKRQGNSIIKTFHQIKDGGFLPVETNINYLEYENKEYLIDFSRDISEHIKSQEQLKRQLERLASLQSINRAITASLDLQITFDVLLNQIISQLKVDAADILLMDAHKQRLEFVAGRGFKTSALRYSHLSCGEGHAGRAAQERRIIKIKNLNTSNEFLKRSPLLAQEGFVTYLGQPLIAKGQVVGVLEVFNCSPFEPDQDWLDFFDAVTAQAAIAIDNARLFSDLQKSNLELLQAYDTTIEGWSRALDLRDKETEGHSQRVTGMTVKIVQAWENMGNDELRYVRWGALLHDIGKMGIPDSILLKPGPLTEEESKIIQRHPMYAYNLLYPITFLRPALDIPYCHHEKWDGTGYSRGLKGDQIPLSARIFAVIDVWDALCSDRPYRPAWTEDKIRAYILEQKGKHFDPKVVDVFMDMEMMIDS